MEVGEAAPAAGLFLFFLGGGLSLTSVTSVSLSLSPRHLLPVVSFHFRLCTDGCARTEKRTRTHTGLVKARKR